MEERKMNDFFKSNDKKFITKDNGKCFSSKIHRSRLFLTDHPFIYFISAVFISMGLSILFVSFLFFLMKNYF